MNAEYPSAPRPGIRVAAACVGIATAVVLFASIGMLFTAQSQGELIALQWVLVTGIILSGGLLLFTHFRTQQTGRAEAERALERLEAEHRALLEASPDVIFFLSPGRQLKSLHGAFERLTGFQRHEWVGRNVISMLAEEDAARAEPALRSALEGGEPPPFEARLRTIEGIVRHVEITLVPRDDAGRVVSVLGIARDVTEKKSLQHQFIQVQRLENIGRLAGGIAHDLNNILAPILMAVHMLPGHTDNPEVLHLLKTVEESANRGADMVKQILAYVRRGRSVKLVIHPKYLVKDVAVLARETLPRSVTLNVRIAPDVWPIEADPSQIYQVLLNLCVNARDAMPGGGRLVVALANASPGEHTARREPLTGPHICISVTDTGMGIPPENLGRIFEPFFTTKEVGRGTGLGLSTVQNIVQAHNGICEVVSEPGCETAFFVYLPAQPHATVKTRSPDTAAIPLGQGEMVLVVDDEEPCLNLISTLLERYGYRVVKAADGVEAIGKFVEFRDEIRLVVTDLQMPVMGGRALILAIRRLTPHMRVLIVSGSAPRMQEELDNTDSLAKPFGPAQLLTAVRELIQNGGDTDRLNRPPGARPSKTATSGT